MDLTTSAQSRVFLIEDMAGPANPPIYEGVARAMAPDWQGGARTPVRIPDPKSYGKFKTAGFIEGQRGLPTLSIQARYQFSLSDLLRIFRKDCPVDLQVHMGACGDVTDPDRGWEKILVLENARATNWSTGELGAFDGDTVAQIDEEVPFTAGDMYEVAQLTAVEVAQTQVTDEIVSIVICDAASCGACGIASDGFSKIFAIAGPTTGSPGLSSELVYSADSGATWSRTNITSLPLAMAATKVACVGPNIVVISEADEALHYANAAAILAGTATWTRVATGFVATKGPLAIVSLGRTKTWIVGEGGYVYFSSDIEAGVTVQSAGTATTQNLRAIAAFDDQRLVAVGVSNAVLLTLNGGETWGALTGPAVGVQLNAVATRLVQENEWFVGDNAGNLWYTRNLGTTWTLKAFPGSASGIIRDIKFSTPTVGYIAHSSAVPLGRILRTVSGGNSFYVVPEAEGQAMPTNLRIDELAVSPENPNLAFGGGLSAGSDGFIVKLAASGS